MRVLVVSGSLARLPDPVYPLGAAMIATEARRAGHEVTWFDALRHGDPGAALARAIADSEPEVFLFSVRNIDSSAFPSPVLHFDEHRTLAAVCRERSKAPIVLGGSAFSLMPEAFLDHLGADMGVVGEGEGVVADLLGRLARGETVARIVRSPLAAPPFTVPDRDLFDAAWYYEHGGVANLQTKRGCPLECSYCTYPLLEGHATRAVEPRAVADEMDALARAGIRHFFFVDAVFNQPEGHAAAVCEEILRRGLDVSWTAYLAPKGADPHLADLFQRSGCAAVELGTDALCDAMLASYKKGFTAAEAMEFARILAARGIPECHNLVLGGPGETEETLAESVARMDELSPTAVIVTIGLRVYPHTELASTAGLASGEGELTGNQLEPVFYIAEEVADTIVEKVGAWVDARRGWICPGLGKRYNPRYLARLRLHRQRKGVLWPMF